MRTRGLIHILLISTILSIFSCEKKDPFDPDKPNLSPEVLMLNHWIWKEMNDVYLWNDFLPNLDPEYQEDPHKYFYDLRYSGDRESWIVDDYDELRAMFSGVSLSTGMSARPGLIDSERVISIVEYLTPDSPAALAGVERGDIIISIDGQELDTSNYYSLYNQTTASFEFADWDGSQLVPLDKELSLTAIDLNKNPVIHHEVIEYMGKKVAYIVYTQFTTGIDEEWLAELDAVFEEFKNAGISDLIFDLRYNRGGSLGLSAYIASTLAPESVVNNEDVFVNMVWNDRYTQLWKDYDFDRDGTADGDESPQLVVRLNEVPFNLNLSQVNFLTTESTASASESLMAGLYPYMDVVQIGTTTHGKPYGSVTIDDTTEPKRHNWAMQPIVLKWANKDGFTDFINGIDPDIVVQEHLLYLEPFGSLDDPLLATALGEITGANPSRKSLQVFDDAFSPLPAEPVRMVEMHIELNRD